jgi:hypothetical protein
MRDLTMSHGMSFQIVESRHYHSSDKYEAWREQNKQLKKALAAKRPAHN